MQIAPEVHACLNRLLRHELTVINQYFLHARMLNNWGYDALGHTIYKQSIRAMKNADKLIARIFLLEGLPNLQELGKLLIGENAEEIIRCDLQKEQDKHQALVEAIAVCEEKQDYVSRQLLEKQKDENEERLDWLETQLDLVENLGLQNYLQLGAQED